MVCFFSFFILRQFHGFRRIRTFLAFLDFYDRVSLRHFFAAFILRVFCDGQIESLR